MAGKRLSGTVGGGGGCDARRDTACYSSNCAGTGCDTSSGGAGRRSVVSALRGSRVAGA